MQSFDNETIVSIMLGRLYLTGNFYLAYFFINSDSNLTQTQMLTLKLFPNRTLILTPKKTNGKSTDEYFSFLFYSLELESFR